jgi:enoyl-CoA hydratase
MGFVSIQKEGAVATITIDRPQALNALNQEVLLELRETFLKCDGVKVAILTGGGPKAFVAGADIAQMADFNTLQARAFVELGQAVIRMIEESPFITIAAVNGFALGGGLELAMACDLIYASDNARLGLPETNLGIIPGFGGTVNLSQRIGGHKALEMILTGQPLTAADAKALGLVLDVFPQADLMTKAKEIAGKIAKKGTFSCLAARRLVRGLDMMDRERSFLLERETFASLFATHEPKEGMKAFLEKREPKF